MSHVQQFMHDILLRQGAGMQQAGFVLVPINSYQRTASSSVLSGNLQATYALESDGHFDIQPHLPQLQPI
jgi:hypothetical protein